MSNDEIAAQREAVWLRRGEPASESEISKFLARCPGGLPALYIELLRSMNGGEGELGLWPGWFELWPLDKILDANKVHGMGQLHEGFFAFGTSGEGVIFAFDLNAPGRSAVYGLLSESPENGDDKVKVVADDFNTFVKALGRPGPTKDRLKMSQRGYLYLGLLIDGALLLIGCLWLYSRVLSYDQSYRGYCGGIMMNSSPCSISEYRWKNLQMAFLAISIYLWPILLMAFILPPAVLWLIGKRRSAATDA